LLFNVKLAVLQLYSWWELPH